MKGKITLSILEKITEVAGDFSDMFEAYLSAGYGASLRRLEYLQDEASDKRLRRKFKLEAERELRKKCLKTIYKLKQEGFILEKENLFKITAKGKKKRRQLEKYVLGSLPTIQYDKIKSPQIILVAFDVPEEERHKRRWLRDVLKYFDFQMIQQSVWVGFVKIPKEFIEDLSRIDLIDKVEIIGVTRGGTLKKLCDEAG